MKKTVLITGVTGQDGSYLANFLLTKDYRVIGLVTSDSKDKLWRLDHFKIRSEVELVAEDITESAKMAAVIRRYQPHEFYNLAGQSSVARSWENPSETFKVNALAVVQILELLRLHSPHTRFFQASSAEIYGDIDTTITEKINIFRPLHPYGTSKLAAHLAVKNFREQYGLFASNGILYTHISPLQADYTVAKNIAKGAALVACGQADKITVGNIAVLRDWSYAGDVVRAMWMMLQQKKAEDFVICSGKSSPVKSFAEEALRYVGRKPWKKYIFSDKNLMRKNDTKKMFGSSKKLQRLGWRPEVDFKKLVKMMVDFELNALQHGDNKK
ncbi:MAG: hypothetical protein A2754_00695 [Candidatus Magasanikbacteria bacterium RIFCSPHIGHO2_01_FULL_47_8]|uniref:GDP-mannose 4,6-dehydratase n=1 Tax=Candidatus Magasanikbacteria bacterium RIFCSPHIGHO2_01_FULL_47_8 TaxID=1798673 RepID=A0A1F6MEJ5_9BACT|nr:MAG: hypothetical protein A2754_00695 [Candidatus Magasanikbacteria bacterium RIFCSPHIGHO2_01_FULL_47_8]